MKTVIKLTPDQIRLLKEHANVASVNSESQYYYMPFWFKMSGDQWEIISFDRLPKELTEFITKQREL